MPTVQSPQLFQTILGLPVAKLQADLVLDQFSIFISSASDDELATFAINQDQMIVLAPKSLPPDVGVQSGGSRADFRWDMTWSIKVWNRLWTDQAGRDTDWYTNATNGIAPLIHNVLNSLEQHMPIDSTGHYYYIQPFRLLPPGFVFPPKKVGNWGVVDSSWLQSWQENIV